MKTITILFFIFSLSVNAQPKPLDKKLLIEPNELAAKINDTKTVKPIIINIGPVDQIKSAINIGSVSSEEGLLKFKKAIANISKEKEIVVYCGCCSSQNCPNIRPAIEYLSKNGYIKAKVLNIPTGIKEDWVQKGYPIEK